MIGAGRHGWAIGTDDTTSVCACETSLTFAYASCSGGMEPITVLVFGQNDHNGVLEVPSIAESIA